MDTGFNIRTTSDNAGLIDFAAKVNSGTMTVGELAKASRTLKSELIAGSQSAKDYGDMTAQIAIQSRSAASQQNSLIGVMKSSRQEHRLGMFAVMEGMHAIEGFTGKESEMTKSVLNGTQAFFGMKFAMEAMGASASLAWPVAVIVAAWSVISGILAAEKKMTEDLNAELDKQFKLKVSLGLISPQQNLAHAGEGVNQAQADISATEKQKSNLQALYNQSLSAFGVANSQTLMYKNQLSEINLTLEKQHTALLQAELDYTKLYDSQKEHDKVIKDTVKDSQEYTQALTAEHQSEFNLMTLGQQRIDVQKRLNAEKFLHSLDAKGSTQEIKDQTAINILKKQLLDIDNQIAKNRVVEPITKNRRQLAEEYRATHQTIVPTAKEEEKAVDNTEKKTQQAFQNIQGGVSALQGMMGMLHMKTDSFLGDVLEGVNKILMVVETIKSISNAVSAVSSIIAMLGGGGDVVASGSKLQFAANGANFNYGSLQNVIVGERGAELMQVGRNGVRVISNNNLQKMNQMSQSSRGGGNGNAEMARAINNLAAQIVPQTANDIFFATKKAGHIRSGIS